MNRATLAGVVLSLAAAVSACDNGQHQYHYCIDHFNHVVPSYYCNHHTFGYHPFYSTRIIHRGVVIRRSWGSYTRPKTRSWFSNGGSSSSRYRTSGGGSSSRYRTSSGRRR